MSQEQLGSNVTRRRVNLAVHSKRDVIVGARNGDGVVDAILCKDQITRRSDFVERETPLIIVPIKDRR